MSNNSLLGGGFSGRIGEPENAGRLMNAPKVPEEVQSYVQAQISDSGGSGSGGLDSIRVNAAGTEISSSGFTSVSRQSEGYYRTTLSSARSAATAVRPTVTVAATAGNGGDGISPLKAFSNFEVEDTDDSLSNFFKHPTDETLYLLGENSDGVWIHDITIGTFPSTADYVDAGTRAIETCPQSGCLSYEGGYIWFSGKADTYGVRAIKLSDQSLTDFITSPGAGNPAQNQNVIFADDNSGTPRIWVKEASQFARYTPNFGTPSIGSYDFTYSGITDIALAACPLLQDSSGYLWGAVGANLYQLKKTAGDAYSHATPAIMGTGSITGRSRPYYDTVQDRILIVLEGQADAGTGYVGKGVVWEYKGWADALNNSGYWRQLLVLPGVQSSISYDSATGVLFVYDDSNEKAIRYVGDPPVFVDSVSVQDTTPDNADIDYDGTSPYTCYYDGDGYGYIQGKKGANYYIIRIDYQGAEISQGSGGVIVSNVLVPLYSVVSASVVDVYLYRTLSPPQRADGEFTLHVAQE